MTIGPRTCTRLSCNIKVSLRGRGAARAVADSLVVAAVVVGTKK